ncbi:class I adenylate-forming enzyme family protein [Oceanisphaera pacifica]|uniref:Acyl--CoA ligase n=1 Tax=Oceanisphaera pacifica TaxID=2818389 RepID=A0ABS3NJE7_9GAMM|nr:class I adenylate-forming enzyme family protein [Oceanisphaera pacifica]MBO1520702.1 acyl--CoA ligase [Oceanisphaera pacifica]
MSHKLQYNSLYQSLELSAQRWPDRQAFIVGDQSITYRVFLQRVKEVAGLLLHKFELQKNDKIILAIGNEISFCEVFYAAMSLGIIVVPVSTKMTSDEVASLVQQVMPSWVLCHDDHIEKYTDSLSFKSKTTTLSQWELLSSKGLNPVVASDVCHDDTAIIIFTSGTTGQPKGAIISHGNLLHGITSYQSAFSLTEKDSTILAVPIYHITGLAAILGLFIHIGGTINLQRKFNAKIILECIENQNITFMHGSPTVFILLCNEFKTSKTNYKLGSLKKVVCGGGHLNNGTIKTIKSIFKNTDIHPVYGLSETSSPASIFVEDLSSHNKLGSSGKAIPGVEFLIKSKDGETLTNGETGLLWVRGPVVIKSYWNNPLANKESFEDGWFNTGDLAYIDNDNYIYIQGRLKDMINRGGEKIYSLEVENILSAYPGINEVALVPFPSEIYGEEPMAFIIADRDHPITTKELLVWAHTKLTKYKIPKKIIFVENFPRTKNGKISKKILKESVHKYL